MAKNLKRIPQSYRGLQRMARIVPRICRRDTSYRNDSRWSLDNPTFGHCTVVALLVQDIFGGELLRVSMKNTLRPDARFHYYNQLPDGTKVDLTRQQFGYETQRVIPFIPHVVRRRTEVLRVSDVAARYQRLRRRFLQVAMA